MKQDHLENPLTKIYNSNLQRHLLHSLSFLANSFSLYGLIRSFQANERYSSLAFLTTLISVFSRPSRTGFVCEKRIRAKFFGSLNFFTFSFITDHSTNLYMRIKIFLVPVFIGTIFLFACSKQNAISLDFTNAKGEVPQLGNLVFRFNQSLVDDSMLECLGFHRLYFL